MPNPYGKPQGGFLDDYSGISGAGSALQGFAKGIEDAQDRDMKRQELSAKMKSYQAQQQRDAVETAIKARTQGYQANMDTGELTESTPTPKEKFEQNVKLFGEGGKLDESGGIVTDPTSPKAVAAKNSGIRGQTAVERLGFTEHKAAVGAVADDKPTKDLLAGYQSINNAVANFKASGGMPQEFHQLQTALRMNAGSGNRTGVEERSKGYAHDWGISKDEAMQVVTGNISDVSLSSPKMVKAIIGISEAELANKQQQASQQIKKKAGMYSKVYSDRAASYKPDFDDTVKQQYAQFGLDEGGQAPGLVPSGMVKPGMVQGAPGGAQVDAATAAKVQRLNELKAKAAGAK